MRVLPAILAAALLFLSACSAVPEQSYPEAVSAPADTEPSAAPDSAAAPSAAPLQQIEYTEMPLLPEKSGSHVSLQLTDAQEANIRQFVDGLYTNNADAVRAACSDAATAYNFPLSDLTGLNITEYSLVGGTYDYPAVHLTVENAGSTPLLRGCHEYRFTFDTNGKISYFSPWVPYYGLINLAESSLNPQDWVAIQSFSNDSTEEEDSTSRLSGTIVLGHKADSLGLTLDRACAYSYTVHYKNAGNNYESHLENFTYLQNYAIPLTCDGIVYGTPPQGNVVDATELEFICRDLNVGFHTLAEGSYAESFGTELTNSGRLAGWDAAYPLPVSVSPENIRTEYKSPNDSADDLWLYIWVPLPEDRWVAYSLPDTSYQHWNKSYPYLVRCYYTAHSTA